MISEYDWGERKTITFDQFIHHDRNTNKYMLILVHNEYIYTHAQFAWEHKETAGILNRFVNISRETMVKVNPPTVHSASGTQR